MPEPGATGGPAAEVTGKPLGAREEQKRLTRDRIGTAAMRLFAAHGFDATPVTEVAQAAGVTEKTVFNHFATKEDLVYSGDQAFLDALVVAIRDRRPGEAVSAAASAFLLDRYASFRRSADLQVRQRDLARIVEGSPALQARERLILSQYADRLNAEIVAEVGTGADDLRPQVVADALISTHRAVIASFRRAVLAGESPSRFAPRVIASAEAAFQTLSIGLDAYARR